MKIVFLLCVVTLIYLNIFCSATDLIVGTSYNSRLVWQQKAEYMAIPFKKRVKEVFYSDPGQHNIIRGIVARDLAHTGAKATITSGGVGYTYANVRLKSERGGSLNYQVEIYV